jgi:hypothetical protein
MANHEAAEALTLAMLEQSIAAMDPWVADERAESRCFYCEVERYARNAVTGKFVEAEHRADCLWQRCTYAKYREALTTQPDWRSYAPKDHPSRIKGMWWHKPADWELSQNGKGRCSVWLNGIWHTWDKQSTGGENAREDSVEAAKAAAEDAIVRQGWGKFEGGR